MDPPSSGLDVQPKMQVKSAAQFGLSKHFANTPIKPKVFPSNLHKGYGTKLSQCDLLKVPFYHAACNIVNQALVCIASMSSALQTKIRNTHE
eukprot:6467461-Amphidinium_carterae.2